MIFQENENQAFDSFKKSINFKQLLKQIPILDMFFQSLFKYLNQILIFMCETLDEIHEAQLAALIAKMRKAKAKSEKPIEITAQ